MSGEENKAVYQRFIGAFNTGDESKIPEFVAPDWVNHDPALPPLTGHAGARQLMALFRNAFPDVHVSTDEIIAEGDRVAVRMTITGTHRGELMGVPPTGKSIRVGGIGIVRIAGGMVAENWVNFDAMGMMQQLSAAPAPQPA